MCVAPEPKGELKRRSLSVGIAGLKINVAKERAPFPTKRCRKEEALESNLLLYVQVAGR